VAESQRTAVVAGASGFIGRAIVEALRADGYRHARPAPRRDRSSTAGGSGTGIGPWPSGDGRPPRHRTGGRQKFSWVHVDDVVGVLRFVRDRPEIAGPVNVATPEASDNRSLMAALRRRVGAPFGLPATRWMLELGMLVLRNETELLLKSRWVAPRRLLDAGYEFAVTDLDEALAR